MILIDYVHDFQGQNIDIEANSDVKMKILLDGIILYVKVSADNILITMNTGIVIGMAWMQYLLKKETHITGKEYKTYHPNIMTGNLNLIGWEDKDGSVYTED